MEKAKTPASPRRGTVRLDPLTKEEESEIEKILVDLEFDGETEGYSAGRMLITMVYRSTTNPDKLAKITGDSRDLCRLRCQRLRNNGVIIKPRTLDVLWFDDDWKRANTSFICDVLVALGHVGRGEKKNGQPTYHATREESQASPSDAG